MPIYSYKAIGPGGEVKTGVIDADTPRDARSRLRRDKLLVSDIQEAKSRREKVHAPVQAGRLTRALRQYRGSRGSLSGRELDFVTASTRQLGTMLGSGIPLAEAVRAMIEQSQDRRTETIFREIRERINSGGSLADALEEHPHLFSNLYVGMVRAGEATGNVDVVLTRLADYLQYQRTLRRKVVGALTYPVMMILLGMGVVTALMAWVVPKITSMLEDTGQTLPLPTRILVTISEIFEDWWWAGMLLVAGFSFLLERIYKNSEKGRLVLDRFALRVPIVGDVLLKQSVSRFARTLSTLLQSGVPVVQSLEITRNVIPNRVLADATDNIRIKILEGADIATPLRSSGVFPAVVGYMVAVGEQAGELEQMLDRISSAYDEEIEIATDRMTSVLEPILILALAVVVGFIVVSIVLPILQVGNVG